MDYPEQDRVSEESTSRNVTLGLLRGAGFKRVSAVPERHRADGIAGNNNLDALILLASALGRIRRKRPRISEAARRDRVGGNPASDQDLANSFGPLRRNAFAS